MNKMIGLMMMAAALLFVASCASTPTPKPTPEEQTQHPQAEQAQPQAQKPATVAAPDAELAQAKGLQQKVDGYNLGSYDPDNYAAANTDLQAGQDAYGKDNAASKSSLQSAITEYSAVLSKGGPQYLAQGKTQTDASKKAADDLMAAVAVMDAYAAANDVYNRALQEMAAGDIDNASKDLSQARDMFDAVTKIAQQKKDAAMQALQSAQQDQTASQQKADEAQKALQDEGFSASVSAQ
jgi:hypothetical protein